MADHKGDKSKQPPECKDGSTSCPNIKCLYEGANGERWRCGKCGESFWLEYDDMR